MKKSFSRALSLLLVLVMILGVMPTTLAAGSVSVSTSKEAYKPGEGVTLTASYTGSVEGDKYYKWTFNGNELGPFSANDNVLNQTVPSDQIKGNMAVTVTVLKKEQDNSYTTVDTGSGTVKVLAADLTGIDVTPASTASLPVGQSVTLTAAPVPANAETGDITWSVVSGGDYVTITGNNGTCSVQGKAEGTATIKASNGTEEDTAQVTVTPKQYTYTLTDMTLKVGESKSIAPTWTPPLADGEKVAYTYTPTDSEIVSVDSDGKVTGKKAGETTITVKATVKDSTEATTLASDVTKTMKVTVSNDLSISCSNVSVDLDSYSSGTITPKLMNGSTEVSGATFTFSSNATAASDYKSATVSGSSQTVVAVTVTLRAATVGGTALSAEQCAAITDTVYVSFYREKDIEVTMADGVKKLEFSDKTDLQNATLNLAQQMLYGVPTRSNVARRVLFSYVDTAGRNGKLTMGQGGGTDTQLDASLGLVTFEITGGANGAWAFSYDIVDPYETGLQLGGGKVTIKFDGTGRDIVYHTDYNTPVTFDESDFYKFWDGANVTGNLSYIKFGVGTSVPKYGELYSSKTSTAVTYIVDDTDAFYYANSSSSRKSLSQVTYVPVKTFTTAYSVEIPFTAYGSTSGQVAYGTVVIEMNQSTGDIYARGANFGTSGYDDIIADAYKDATGADLGYVIFTLPSANDGKLYSHIPATGAYGKVAQATPLYATNKLYYKQTTGEKQLYNLSFVPAAGKSGKVTLSYTAYNKSGTGPEKGTLVLNVVTRTASVAFKDVNANSYKWASDSVDFLYYEEVAQGTNNRYNPGNNITRQDFMLMLYRAFLEADYSTFAVTSNFPDVPQGSSSYAQEIYKAVGVAKALGIAQGTNNKFNPKSNITRQEAMALIARTLTKTNRTLQYNSGVRVTSFKDYSTISSWALADITELVARGVVTGSNDRINPLSNITRAEMACILHRVITY